MRPKRTEKRCVSGLRAASRASRGSPRSCRWHSLLSDLELFALLCSRKLDCLLNFSLMYFRGYGPHFSLVNVLTKEL